MFTRILNFPKSFLFVSFPNPDTNPKPQARVHVYCGALGAVLGAEWELQLLPNNLEIQWGFISRFNTEKKKDEGIKILRKAHT